MYRVKYFKRIRPWWGWKSISPHGCSTCWFSQSPVTIDNRKLQTDLDQKGNNYERHFLTLRWKSGRWVWLPRPWNKIAWFSLSRESGNTEWQSVQIFSLSLIFALQCIRSICLTVECQFLPKGKLRLAKCRENSNLWIQMSSINFW